MRLKHPWWRGLVDTVLGGLVGVTAVAAAGEQFVPILGAREGSQKTIAIPMTNGFIDYLALLNKRDGGINGLKLVWEECETVYDVPRGLECYERLKTREPTGAALVQVFGTPLTYTLTERATRDQIPLLSIGFGRSDVADGRVFPYVFTAARLKELGAEGLFSPITLSCRDHEGGGSVKFQQWDGTQWHAITDWIAPDQALVRPLIEASAAKYAKEKGITPRDCP